MLHSGRAKGVVSLRLANAPIEIADAAEIAEQLRFLSIDQPNQPLMTSVLDRKPRILDFTVWVNARSYWFRSAYSS